MASNKNELAVGQYTVNLREVLGQGSYGIIYTAKNEETATVAAKRIDLADRRNSENILKALELLLPLRHSNVVRYFHIFPKEHICWIFMEYCRCRDLGKFFSTSDFSDENTVDAMIQMTRGVEYLHRENVVHRDIKPENVLVANVSPLVLKLTDFDLSKFLGEDYDTSQMSSNVGTAAFKAPEFFMRNDQRKLEYHRSVDIYALGLTFLAVVQGNKPLVPKLETAKDDSELYNPIGSTMATRKRYGAKPLTVIPKDKGPSIAGKFKKWLRLNSSPASSSDSSSGAQQTTTKANDIRDLILKMTKIEPKDRPLADEVLQVLRSLTESDQLTLVEGPTWHTDLRPISTCMNKKNQLILRLAKDRKFLIQLCNRVTGEILNEITSICRHPSCVNEFPNDEDKVLEACCMCNVIRLYNTQKGAVQTILAGPMKPWRVCTKSANSLVVLNARGYVCELQQEDENINIVFCWDSKLQNALRMCYDSGTEFLILTDLENEIGRVQAFHFGDGVRQWEFTGEVEGKAFNPSGVCCNSKGLVFIGDFANKRIFVLNSVSGELLKILEVEMSSIKTLHWSDTNPCLTAQRESRQFTCYNVE